MSRPQGSTKPLLPGYLGIGACASATSPRGDSVVTVSLTGAPAAASASSAPSAITISGGDDVLAIPSVQVVLGRIELAPARATCGSAGAAVNDGDCARVAVRSTFDGRDFFWTQAPAAEFQAAFLPPLAIDGATVNLTVHADVTGWFKTQSGSLIDPSAANAGGANAGAVGDNIRRSFTAFRDDDRDGQNDADRHGTS